MLFPADVAREQTLGGPAGDEQGNIGILLEGADGGRVGTHDLQDTYTISLRRRLRGIAQDGLLIHKGRRRQIGKSYLQDMGCWTGSMKDAPLQLGWTWMHPSGRIAVRLVRFRRDPATGDIVNAYVVVLRCSVAVGFGVYYRASVQAARELSGL